VHLSRDHRQAVLQEEELGGGAAQAGFLGEFLGDRLFNGIAVVHLAPREAPLSRGVPAALAAKDQDAAALVRDDQPDHRDWMEEGAFVSCWRHGRAPSELLDALVVVIRL
jgi:hypothetical protein